jgi:hypothetical protein
LSFLEASALPLAVVVGGNVVPFVGLVISFFFRRLAACLGRPAGSYPFIHF